MAKPRDPRAPAPMGQGSDANQAGDAERSSAIAGAARRGAELSQQASSVRDGTDATTLAAAGARAGADALRPSAAPTAAGARLGQSAIGAAQIVSTAASQSPTPALQGEAPRPPVAEVARSLPLVGEAVELAESLLGAGRPRIDPVRYEFALPNGPDLELRVRRVRWTEALSQAYTMEIELVCDDVDAPYEELLGADCELLLDRNDMLRSTYGVIERVEGLATYQPGVERAELGIRVFAVPAFKLLEQEIDTRFFQGKSVPEVLQEVLGAALGSYERELDAQTHLKGEYNKRDYCVQFRESTFDFCNRLMEEEGIAYTFVGDDDNRKEKLVLFDNNNDYPEVSLLVDEDVPIVVHRPDEADRETIQRFDWVRPRRPNKIATRGFNAKVPSSPDVAEAEREDQHHRSPRSQYLHDGGRQIIDDPVGDPEAQSFTGEALAQREPLAQRVLQLFTAQTKIGRGASNVTGFGAGRTFTLGEHPHPDLDAHAFLLTKVVHEGEVPHAELGARAEAEVAHYANRFECIPVEHEFRPERRTTRPRELGVQTGKVVGPRGEEIHTDKLGRIRVKFWWDRHSPEDPTASCWIRVAQSWSGPGYGAMFVPRVGMEVLVSFIDGNPDCPIVTGCVYNGDNAPPYTLPDEKTKTTWKTASSPGGDGYNELTFEDAAGNEQIIVHAQKDMNETVQNDHTTTVHNNQTISVDASQSTSVGGDQSNTVKGNQTESVTKNVTVTVQGTRTQTITKAETVTLQDSRATTVGKTELHQVTQKLTEAFDGGRQTTVKQGDTEQVATGDKTVDVTAGQLMVTAKTKIGIVQNGQHGITFENKVLLSTATDFAMTNGKVTVESEGGKLKLTGADELSLACGSASITLKKDGSIDIQGSKKVTAGTPGTSFTAEPAGATINGAKITSQAMGIHEVKGALVKIN